MLVLLMETWNFEGSEGRFGRFGRFGSSQEGKDVKLMFGYG